MDEQSKMICDSIFKLIQEQLDSLIEEDIFVKKSFEELGRFYYDYIISQVNGATVQLINIVVRTIGVSDDFDNQDCYYKEITKILGIENLPSNIIETVRNEFNAIFVTKLNSVIAKYEIEINRVITEQQTAKTESDEIKKATPTYSIIRDISIEENRLYELCAKCNSLRTRKEMLVFAFEYINKVIGDFCDLSDPQSVEKAIRQVTLKYSKNNSEFIRNQLFYEYKNAIEIFEDDIERDYAVFFKIKIYTVIEKANKLYHSRIYSSTEDENLTFYQEYISNIPKLDDMYMWKSTNQDKYVECLDNLIDKYGLLVDLMDEVKNSVCLRRRKSVLLNAIELYENGEYEVFNNIVPVQIEGMFADYLRDTTTFIRFSHMNIYEDAVLQGKIRLLNEAGDNLYPEATEYFMYFFNNLIRNKVAHGRYYAALTNYSDIIFSKELLLDLCLLVHMFSRKSETEKMYRFIHGYQAYYNKLIKSEEHPCFGALFNDVIGNKIISEYDSVETYRPIQVAYWLVNPYYEKIYEQIEDKAELLSLREEFLSKDFWAYVLERLTAVKERGFDYLNINKEFSAVVRALFRCDITDETRTLLGRVNALMNQISSFM